MIALNDHAQLLINDAHMNRQKSAPLLDFLGRTSFYELFYNTTMA